MDACFSKDFLSTEEAKCQSQEITFTLNLDKSSFNKECILVRMIFSKSFMHWDKVSGRLIGQCCTKETGYLESITDRACGGLGTDNSSLFIAKSPGTESLAPLRLQPQPQTGINYNSNYLPYRQFDNRKFYFESSYIFLFLSRVHQAEAAVARSCREPVREKQTR